MKKNTIVLLFKQLRPKQWTKNLLVFAALIFSFKSADTDMLIKTIECFFLFSFVSGCVYILNDFVDREADRQHPEKKNRPMASGALNPYLAITVGAILLIGSLGYSFYLSTSFGVVLTAYFILNVAYSFKLKHVVIIDIMIIASGFVFRAFAGATVINEMITPWFFLCTLTLALFLAINKRRHELYLLEHKKGSHRKVLEQYSKEFLDQLSSITTTASIMCYSLFTFTSKQPIELMWTIPFVIYGIFRYLQLVHVEGKGGKPDQILLEDKPTLINCALFVLTVIVILAYF